MTEPTRPLADPVLNKNGKWVATSTMSPTAVTTRGAVTLPSNRVIPVILVPGIMGTNLRAKIKPTKGEENEQLKPGEAAWRPPNTSIAGVTDGKKWKARTPKERQEIFSGETLEVDDQGDIGLENVFFLDNEATMRIQGWGEVHKDSYSKLLNTLNKNLNRTFRTVRGAGVGKIMEHWTDINEFDRKLWGGGSAAVTTPLTEAEMQKHARYHFPIYACGYNWLESNELSAQRLQRRIMEVIHFWSSRKQVCTQVILVTHSMGGLVARACAKNIPGQIAGIVHGVMPALGAPVAYRRIACGTERVSPTAKGTIDSTKVEVVAEIVGETSAQTTAVMATSAGALELLPNHLFTERWLRVSALRWDGLASEYYMPPMGNPYDFYRDITSWFRLIDPDLADPAGKFKGEVVGEIKRTINQVEKFHRTVLGTYYHPNTYVFYGNTFDQRTYGVCDWTSKDVGQSYSTAQIMKGKPHGYTTVGRRVLFSDKTITAFQPAEQAAAGDGTVPSISGHAPSGHVRQIFAAQGFDHQGCYQNEAMLALTQHLIVKIVQEAT